MFRNLIICWFSLFFNATQVPMLSIIPVLLIQGKKPPEPTQKLSKKMLNHSLKT
jgi:hypothetical protein